MKEGWFTGRRLDQFFKDGLADFENARTIVNGLDKAPTIADIARRFNEVLLEAIMLRRLQRLKRSHYQINVGKIGK